MTDTDNSNNAGEIEKWQNSSNASNTTPPHKMLNEFWNTRSSETNALWSTMWSAYHALNGARTPSAMLPSGILKPHGQNIYNFSWI